MSLREEWAGLSARERDAKVAEALGCVLSDPSLFGGSRFIRQQPETEWETILPVPPYVTTWEHAGALLDKLRAEGWEWHLSEKPETAPKIILWSPGAPKRCVTAFAFTAPEAIAFAFCLAKEATDAPA